MQATAQGRTTIRAPATKDIKKAIVQFFTASEELPKECAMKKEFLTTNATALLDGAPC